MGKRIGIIAGSGEFPLVVLEEARKAGYDCAVAAIRGNADERLAEKVQTLHWIEAGEVASLVAFFKENGIQEAVFAGKVDPGVIFVKEKLDETALRIVAQADKKTPLPLILGLVNFLADKGIQVMDPSPFIAPFFCPEGILTEAEPGPEVEADIAFGWNIAKNIADLDIGQTVIVKNQVVAAVEGLEGTDEAIRRGGRLAGRGTVAVKVSRTSQDPRLDLPAVGLSTIHALAEAGGRALCFEARKMPFFQRPEAVALASSSGISIVARKA